MAQKDLVGMNAKRAGWVEKALKTFCRQTGQNMDVDGFEEVASDFIADLMHLARSKGIEFEVLIEKAEFHYGCETDTICVKCRTPFDQECDAVEIVDRCPNCQV